MPLPATLLARLKNRGIVRQDGGDQVEEVFAESYDDKEQPEHASQPALADPEFTVKVVYEVVDCPNLANRYHECSDYCKSSVGFKTFLHKPSDEKKRVRMLKKYPLPSGWLEVGDPTTGRCYYWNGETDKVSWLPPQHPRAKITVSAEKLQSRLSSTGIAGSSETAHSERRKPVSVAIREPASKRRAVRVMERQKDELDPMDPASYSEVERGSWSTGLKADTKTGVDTTANGPLFQQRPYPSPGDILRAQAAQQQ